MGIQRTSGAEHINMKTFLFVCLAALAVAEPNAWNWGNSWNAHSSQPTVLKDSSNHCFLLKVWTKGDTNQLCKSVLKKLRILAQFSLKHTRMKRKQKIIKSILCYLVIYVLCGIQ